MDLYLLEFSVKLLLKTDRRFGHQPYPTTTTSTDCCRMSWIELISHSLQLPWSSLTWEHDQSLDGYFQSNVQPATEHLKRWDVRCCVGRRLHRPRILPAPHKPAQGFWKVWFSLWQMKVSSWKFSALMWFREKHKDFSYRNPQFDCNFPLLLRKTMNCIEVSLLYGMENFY